MVKYCPRCGAANEDNAMYCKQCGNPLPPSPSQDQQASTQQPGPQQPGPQPPYPPPQQQFYQQPQFVGEQYPGTAYILSLIGGIFVLLGGIIVMVVGAIFTVYLLGIGGLYGVLGIIWGIIILIGASRLKSRPMEHNTWGIIILVFSILSWFGGMGGLFIGFLLGLIGGILALTWHPPMYHM
ncbi:MAG: zinc ribbon domain-containing protein [Thermoplasmata archaeon]